MNRGICMHGRIWSTQPQRHKTEKLEEKSLSKRAQARSMKVTGREHNGECGVCPQLFWLYPLLIPCLGVNPEHWLRFEKEYLTSWSALLALIWLVVHWRSRASSASASASASACAERWACSPFPPAPFRSRGAPSL